MAHLPKCRYIFNHYLLINFTCSYNNTTAFSQYCNCLTLNYIGMLYCCCRQHHDDATVNSESGFNESICFYYIVVTNDICVGNFASSGEVSCLGDNSVKLLFFLHSDAMKPIMLHLLQRLSDFGTNSFFVFWLPFWHWLSMGFPIWLIVGYWDPLVLTFDQFNSIGHSWFSVLAC